MSEPPVTRAVQDGVARFTLDRPRIPNALNPDLAAALADHVAAAVADPDVVLVVGGGAGRAFSSGMVRTALACDLRAAAADAVLGLGATRHGVIPDGAVGRLARVAGRGRAEALTLLNDDVGAVEACAIGLFHPPPR